MTLRVGEYKGQKVKKKGDLKCPMTALAAPKPTTGPKRALATGTTAIASIHIPRPARPGMYVAPIDKSSAQIQFTKENGKEIRGDEQVATLPPPLEPSKSRI